MKIDKIPEPDKQKHFGMQGNCCPYCNPNDDNDGDMDHGDMEWDDGNITIRTTCNSCKRSWTDYYSYGDASFELSKASIMDNLSPWARDIIDGWEYVEKHYPNYSSSNRILQHDILCRCVDGEEISNEDSEWIRSITETPTDQNIDKKKVAVIFENMTIEIYNSIQHTRGPRSKRDAVNMSEDMPEGIKKANENLYLNKDLT